MRETRLKLPADVHALLRRRFDNRHRDWLAGPEASAEWPLTIPLGIPTEQAVRDRMDAALAWVRAWQSWQGVGELCWTERRWRTLGTQRVPEFLRLDSPRDVAIWLDDTERWDRARRRHAELCGRWPALTGHLGRVFDVLADYPDAEFVRLTATLAWLEQHPDSGVYLRQLPIPGLDTKWIEARKAVLAELLCRVTDRTDIPGDFHALCGLRRPPFRLRMRVLDPALRAAVGGLGDLTVPIDDLEQLRIEPRHVVIVENLQTGLALGDLPGTVTFMGLGYGAELLARLSWVNQADCLYWGDIDTHGFAILSQLRAQLPGVRSMFMDEPTLLSHRALWTHEPSQHAAPELSGLHPGEQAVYRALKLNTLGPAVRLEQERISWDLAWPALVDALAPSGDAPPTA
jgi:hypothetical protein